jgi:NADH-quinone oxidoreductase subunit N
MKESMLAELAVLVPELILLGGAIGGLLLGLFLPRRRQWLVAVLAVVAAAAAIVATLIDLNQPVGAEMGMAFEGAYEPDLLLGVTRLAVLAGTALTVLLSIGTVRGHARETEYYVLLQLGALGVITLAGAGDLLMLGAAYLLASAPLYALTGFAKDSAGTEAALKYYLMGAFLGVLMLVGITLLYAAGLSTSYEQLAERLTGAPVGLVALGLIALLAGLMFKAGGVPGHFWVPDVTQGAPAPVAAFVTTIPKVGALVATYRLVAEPFAEASLQPAFVVAVIAAATMTLGNLAAFFQTDVRRLLAYSTISQVGYILLAATVALTSPAAEPALLFYLAGYTLTNLGAFGVVVALPKARALADYAGLFKLRPGLGVALVICLLGLIGTPPTAVFFGKLGVFTAAVDGGYGWLAVLAVLNTVASVFYYLRWIAPLSSPRRPATARTLCRQTGGRVARRTRPPRPRFSSESPPAGS